MYKPEMWRLDYEWWSEREEKWKFQSSSFPSFQALLEDIWFNRVWPMPKVHKDLGIEHKDHRILRIIHYRAINFAPPKDWSWR